MTVSVPIEEQDIVVRSEQGRARTVDPDRLLADWHALLAKNRHTHPPEVARLLDVPESALIASRIGSGAVRLIPDIEKLLNPIAGWGRVLCAFSNACGVHMPLGDVAMATEAEALVLQGAHMRALIDKQAVRDAYLFVDTDESHGNTRSLQFFDAEGDPVVKVFIFHKTRFADAEAHLLANTSERQSRLVQTMIPGSSQFDAEEASVRDDPDKCPLGWSASEMVASELSGPGAYEVELVGDHVRVIWKGQLSGARIDEAMFHLHESDIRSHLRYGALTSLVETRSGAIAFNGKQGRLLRIMKGADQ